MQARIDIHESPACLDMNLQFCILGKFDPIELTKLFGVEPTEIWAKGESDGFRQRDFSKWGVRSDHFIKSTNAEKHALALLEVLEPGKVAIQEYAKANKVVVSLWWEGLDYVGGFEFHSETMIRLASLCNQMHFHFVCSADLLEKGDRPEKA